MLDRQLTEDILSKGKPEPSDVLWWGEPNLGGWFTAAEIEAAVRAIRESNNWVVGFGPNPKEIEEFEKAFANYCGVKYAVAVNSCGTGLNMAMMCLDLEPGEEFGSRSPNTYSHSGLHGAWISCRGRCDFLGRRL